MNDDVPYLLPASVLHQQRFGDATPTRDHDMVEVHLQSIEAPTPRRSNVVKARASRIS